MKTSTILILLAVVAAAAGVYFFVIRKKPSAQLAGVGASSSSRTPMLEFQPATISTIAAIKSTPPPPPTQSFTSKLEDLGVGLLGTFGTSIAKSLGGSGLFGGSAGAG
jgi:hypothetical protein